MDGKKQGSRICSLTMALLTALLFGKAANAGAWATIAVNSLADPGAQGICALRDAITAANTMTATNGCIAGKGHDTIEFSVTGTIKLADTLPEIADSQLTIKGPITLDGGGAVRVMQVGSGTTLNLKDVTIVHGHNDTMGGGINNNGTLTISNSIFSGNDVGVFQPAFGGSCGSGGGINNTGTLTINDSTFSNNSAGGTTADGLPPCGIGGGINNNGMVTINDSTFSDNDANRTTGSGGGGIFNHGALSISNSTFSGNFAEDGGGAISNFAELTVINSTFFENNSFEGPGGAIEGAVSLSGSILAKSGSRFGDLGNCGGAITDLGYNLSDDNSCGFNATGSLNNTDPMLDPAGLANNGGPTQTIALLLGSPAIDAIPISSCTDQDGNHLTTDQRGFPRPDAGEGACDIGAFEFQDFGGDPRSTNCYSRSVSALSHRYRTFNAAASAMGFRNVRALQQAIRTFCRS